MVSLRTLRVLVFLGLFSGYPSLCRAEVSATSISESLPTVKWGAFVDTYYAYDFNRPNNFDRAYTTQPLRANEFNLNLGYLEVVLSEENIRGRFALQTGTSVAAIYSTEPSIGQYSGPSLGQTIQEAVIGYQLAQNLWLDAGIYFSHLGFETFISKNNWTYSRSLGADYTPYYQSGIRLSYEFDPDLSAQLHLINGWQNISNLNQQKALGYRLAYRLNGIWKITYNGFIGNVDGTRIFHDLINEVNLSEKFQIALSLDFGQQKIGGADDFSNWYVATFLARYQLSPIVAWAARVEKYIDPSQANVFTGTPDGFNVLGASTNVDVSLASYLTWRSEVRSYSAIDSIFPQKAGLSKTDTYIAQSLSISF